MCYSPVHHRSWLLLAFDKTSPLKPLKTSNEIYLPQKLNRLCTRRVQQNVLRYQMRHKGYPKHCQGWQIPSEWENGDYCEKKTSSTKQHNKSSYALSRSSPSPFSSSGSSSEIVVNLLTPPWRHAHRHHTRSKTNRQRIPCH